MKVAVVGLGLIGGSFAKAAARAGHAVSYSDPALFKVLKVFNGLKDPDNAPNVSKGFNAPKISKDFNDLKVFRALDAGELDVGLSEQDLILIAIPPAAVVPWIEAHQASFRPGAIVVDATGVKTEICAALRKYAIDCPWTFIGGHPMAGKEVSGFENSTADLFKGASMILTPYPSCGRGPLDLLEAFFRGLGFGRVVFTTPEHHDEMIALTSQLAHVVSSAYIQDPRALDHQGYSAGSFHDMTRVARLDPDIWTDLFLANRTALLDVLSGLIDRLDSYRSALAAADAETLRKLLAAGRAARLESAPEKR